MSYFADLRKANQEANRAAIETHKTLSPYADYEGGKYEPMQYEGREGDEGISVSIEDTSYRQTETL
jgi:hypothetical protein